jgi:hypothetical protein
MLSRERQALGASEADVVFIDTLDGDVEAVHRHGT